jgi:hypothetical protein
VAMSRKTAHANPREVSGVVGPSNIHNRLTNAYLRPWATFYSRQKLARALTVTPLIAVFAYAVATDAWRSVEPAVEPGVAAYYRSLTRRMHRESIRIEQERVACAS